jgi:hypothetical protein
MGILSDQQIEKVRRTKTANAQEHAARLRERNRINKQKQREREAVAKAAQVLAEAKAQEAVEQYKTIQEWWDANRKTLRKEERRIMEGQHLQVLDMMLVMRDYVNGTDQTSEQDLLETVLEVKSMAAQGLVETAILAIPRIWETSEQAFRNQVEAKGGPTVVFMLYGYLTGLPSLPYHEFRKKFESLFTPPVIGPLPEIKWATMVCTMCPDTRRPASSRVVPQQIADRYRELDKPLICHICAEGVAKAMKAAGFRTEFNAFDTYGRVRDGQ